MTTARRRTAIALSLGVFALIALLGLRAVAEEEAANPYAKELAALNLHPAPPGVEAPSVPLKNVEDARGQLSDYRGKVVLLNFWATW